MPLAGENPLRDARRSVQSGGRCRPPFRFVRWPAPRRRGPQPSPGTWPLETKPSQTQAVSFQKMNLLELERCREQNHTNRRECRASCVFAKGILNAFVCERSKV